MSLKSVPTATEQPLRVAFLYMKGRVARLPEVERGAAPTEFFYGAIEMARAGHIVSHWEIDPSAPPRFSDRLLGRLWPPTMRPVKTEPATVTQVFRLARELNQADCLVATGGNIAFALAALSTVGVIRRPIIGIQCGVLNFSHSFLRRHVSRILLRKMHTLLFGESELEPMRRFFDLPAAAITVNFFGVDTRFWRPDSAVKRDLVLAVGNDSRRDFQTLIDAAPNIPAPVHIVTRLPLPAALPANVTHHRGSWHGAEISDEQMRELYQRALAVVVPLKPSIQPSGQSVTLQAMACGCPVVLTETEGLWSRDHLEDGRNIFFVRPGDSAQLAARAVEAIRDTEAGGAFGRAGRETAERLGNIETFSAEVARQCIRGVSRTDARFC